MHVTLIQDIPLVYMLLTLIQGVSLVHVTLIQDVPLVYMLLILIQDVPLAHVTDPPTGVPFVAAPTTACIHWDVS